MPPEASSDLIPLYLKRNPQSQKAFEKAKRILPGGSTREVIFYPPYPLYVKKGKGCRIWDLDGHEILDFLNNYMSLILGHAHPKIVEAVKAQVEDGTAYSSPTEYESRVGAAVQERMPSIRSIRFTNSGSEATTLALLAAKGFTKRKKVAKFEGAHHGTNEATMVSTTPSLKDAGNPEEPKPIPDGPHIPNYILENTVVLPFNNSAASERLIQKHRGELAAVMVEPILGSNGVIPAEQDFISLLREVTESNGIPLIFDEVVTGFRVSRGGAQEQYGVTPDLTALGKNLGGGLPAGAFGGREDIMAQFDPARALRIPHSGSFNANPVSLRAGLALLDELTPSLYEKLDELGAYAARGLRRIFDEEGVAVQVTRAASLFCVHFTSEDVVDYRSAMSEDSARKFNFFLGLLLNDVMLAPRGLGCISAPMSRREVETLLQKTVATIRYLKER
ncbi:MAG: aspartate aminotransferase family protein [Nitrososphaerales archaeon]